MPTPPQPMTITLSPGCTFARCTADPQPVATPQLTRATTSRGRSGSTRTKEVSVTRSFSEKVPSWAKRAASVSPIVWECEPSSRVIICRSNSLEPSLQRFWRPVEHHRQRPQLGMNDMATWSPGCTAVTPGPTAATTPEPSWPPMKGKCGTSMSPWTTCSSEWHMPANAVSTSTSPGPGSSRVRSSTFQSW